MAVRKRSAQLICLFPGMVCVSLHKAAIANISNSSVGQRGRRQLCSSPPAKVGLKVCAMCNRCDVNSVTCFHLLRRRWNQDGVFHLGEGLLDVEQHA